MSIKENKEVYIYSDDCKLLDHYNSINRASRVTGIPLSSLINALDKRDTNIEKRTVRAKRIYVETYDQYVFLKSTKLDLTRRIVGI